jgi:hypothetical protein
MAPRTLLLAPPSISAHPEVLDRVYEIHDRSATDLQMLDRLAAGLVQLPASTYDVVLLLTDADGTTRESHKLLGRDIMTKVVDALRAGGHFKSQDGLFGDKDSTEKTEAILAGLIDGIGGMMKPEPVESVSIPLKFGKKKPNGVFNGVNGINGTNGTNGVNGHTFGLNGVNGTNGNHVNGTVNADGSVPLNLNGKRNGANGANGNHVNGTVNADGSVPLNLNGKRKSPEPVKPFAVGFVDFSDDLDDPIITGEDDDLIDEDDLITEEDKLGAIIQRKLSSSLAPPPSRPN